MDDKDERWDDGNKDQQNKAHTKSVPRRYTQRGFFFVQLFHPWAPLNGYEIALL
jgi:hypothetical protein